MHGAGGAAGRRTRALVRRGARRRRRLLCAWVLTEALRCLGRLGADLGVDVGFLGDDGLHRCWLSWCGIVGVELPRRKRGIKGTRPSTSATYRMGVGEGSYSLCTPIALGSKVLPDCASVEHELDLDVVRAVRVIGPALQPCSPGPQMAREKQLRPDHPTLVEGNRRRSPGSRASEAVESVGGRARERIERSAPADTV